MLEAENARLSAYLSRSSPRRRPPHRHPPRPADGGCCRRVMHASAAVALLLVAKEAGSARGRGCRHNPLGCINGPITGSLGGTGAGRRTNSARPRVDRDSSGRRTPPTPSAAYPPSDYANGASIRGCSGQAATVGHGVRGRVHLSVRRGPLLGFSPMFRCLPVPRPAARASSAVEQQYRRPGTIPLKLWRLRLLGIASGRWASRTGRDRGLRQLGQQLRALGVLGQLVRRAVHRAGPDQRQPDRHRSTRSRRRSRSGRDVRPDVLPGEPGAVVRGLRHRRAEGRPGDASRSTRSSTRWSRATTTGCS